MLKYKKISAKLVAKALNIAHDPKQAKIRTTFFRDEYRLLQAHIKKQNVLVVGSGLGHDTFLMAKKNTAVTGIEIIKPFVAAAKKQARLLKLNNVSFIHTDFMKYKPETTFDAVILNMGTIGNFDDPAKVFKKLLSFGDTLYIDFYHTGKKSLLKRKKMYAQESWTKLYIQGNKVCNEAGFESASFSKKYIASIIKSIAATATYYPISDFASLAVVTKR